ncbi:hypothetical protein QE370_003460 [Aeromicrobium sp. SORGH_AS981]|uniref:DUF4383 domain-containing protein n=1 Tax=Aeromicrobium sp. SORGH_AS_0981 TaxID=3041802 RepID=UPI002858A76B|nr:DUF4383 domain-containing protein [Aeromicrobium sp. SORGH_AS_0981]MDR6120276.1 hypothetical protein [Aeromicrobium sp. SORGH_AS_0981]
MPEGQHLSSTGPRPDEDPEVLARGAASLFGALFLAAGVLGFVPGLTTHLDQLSGSGHHSGAELFGVFQVSVLHNVVHLLFGLLGLAAALRPRLAPAYLVGSGIVYAALTIYGLVIDHGSDSNVVPVDTADTWLHAVLAIAMLLIGFAVGSALQRKGQYTR